MSIGSSLITFYGLISILEIASVLLTLAIVVLLVYTKQKKFYSTDPTPELLQYIPSDSPITTSTVEVSAGIYIKNFNEFDFILNKFTIDMIVWFEFNPSLIDLNVIKKFSFEKGKILSMSDPEMKLQQDRLLVKYNVQVSISTNLDNRLFPFNDHNLYLVLLNEYVSPSEMVFRVYESYFSWSDSIHTEDWNIAGKTVETGYTKSYLDRGDPNKNLVHPRAIFTLLLVRAGIRKTLLVILPIFLVLFIGLISLSLDPLKLAGTLFSLSVGSVSGLLAYRFVLEKISPNVGYFTAMDYLYFTILGCAFITFIVIFLLFTAVDYRQFVLYIAKGVFYASQLILISMTYYLLYLWQKNKTEKVRVKNKKIKSSELLLPKTLTLGSLKKYAAIAPEHPKPNGTNWLNPDYTSFYYQNRATLWKRLRHKIKNFFSRNDKTYWVPDIFECYLEKLLNHGHEIASFNNEILKLNINKSTRIVVWGDLKGAFHSLCRDLEELKHQGIIDDSLEIVQKNYYLVINGDAINRSPYVMETLVIIFYLILKNPKHVIYTCGNHESKNLWHNYQLAKELKIRARYLSSAPIPLGDEMTKLFSILPKAFYLRVTHKNKPAIIRLSHFTAPELEYEEACYANFLFDNKHPGELEGLRINGEKLPDPFFKVDVLVRGINRTVGYQRMASIELLPPENGATTWSLVSSPTSCYQILYRFYDDCFAILSIENQLDNCILTLFQQDVRNLNGFTKTNFSLYYGFELYDTAAWKKIKNKKELLLGSSLDLSRTPSILGKRLFEGLTLGLNLVNQHHLKRDYFFHQIFLDDQYTPPMARQNVNRLLEVYNTDIILAPLGTPTVESFLPLVEEKKILVLFPYSGASIFRRADLTNFIHYRTSYSSEAKTLVHYAINFCALKRIAFFYQDDSYGQSALEGAKEEAAKYDLVETIDIPYQRNIPNVDEAAAKILGFNPNAIFFFSTSTQAIALAHKLSVNYLVSKKLFGISFLTDAFRDFLKNCGLELTLSRVSPSVNSDLEIAEEFRRLAKEFNFHHAFNEDSLEGFINIQILDEVVHKISGEVTKEKIIAQMEQIRDYYFKGLILNFDPITRELSKNVWIDLGNEIPWIKGD